MAKPQDQIKEILTFEEVKGGENTFKAKVQRDGKTYEISVFAFPGDEFEKANEEYMEKVHQVEEYAS